MKHKKIKVFDAVDAIFSLAVSSLAVYLMLRGLMMVFYTFEFLFKTAFIPTRYSILFLEDNSKQQELFCLS